MKTCTRCLNRLEFSEFTNDKSRKDGKHPHCRACNSAKLKSWREKNPEKANAASALWRNKNPDKAKRSAKSTKMRTAVKARMRDSRRRAAEKNAQVCWSDEKKMEEFYFAADFLGMVTGEWYHVDHIVPLQSRIVCGFHTEQNLQVLPASDNLRKNNRHWPDMP